MNDDEKAKYLIDHMEFMAVSTANASGKPWISPVFFSHDDHNSLYWVSDKSCQHSRNIRGRPEVAVAIYGLLPDGGVEGIYFDAQARELEAPEEVRFAMSVMRRRRQADKFMIHSLADVTGDACWRIYVASPSEITKREDAIDETSGQAITIRKPVQL